MPRWGAPPAWAAWPRKVICLTTHPLEDSLTPVRPSARLELVCTIIAMSTSSNAPTRNSSGLPPRNSIFPAARRPKRYPTSTYSSAGTAIHATRPDSSDSTPDLARPVVVPIMVAICALCPQAWAAPVVRSAAGWSATMSESSSPSTATVGPGALPVSIPFTPVSARSVSKGIPSARKRAATCPAVRVSLKPSSGCRKMSSARAIKLSAC